MLQQYYVNVQTAGNRDYAYFQLSYFDFPEQDSLTKIFGPTIKVKMVIRIKDLAGNSYTHIKAFDLVISVVNVTSATEFADAIKKALFSLDFLQDDGDEREVLRGFLCWVGDFYYDSAA